MAENKGLIADVRPGSVEVTGQQRELFPFDAFRYRNADLQPGEQDTESIYSDDDEPSIDMNNPFALNMRGRNSKANVRSIRVSEILGPDVVDQAIPDTSDFDLDATFDNDEVWDAGNAEGFEFDDVAGDERGEYDAPIGAIAIKSPVLLTGGLYIDDDETKLRLTSTSFKLGSISEDGTTGTGFVYDYDGDTMKFSGELKAATGTFSGELEAAIGTFSGKLFGGSIDIGPDVFAVSSGGLITYNATKLVLGSGASATGYNSSAIGVNSTASGSQSAAFGNGAAATAGGSSAIGGGTASGGNSISVGPLSTAAGEDSIAIGYLARAYDNDAIAIGGVVSAGGTGADGPIRINIGSNAMAFRSILLYASATEGEAYSALAQMGSVNSNYIQVFGRILATGFPYRALGVALIYRDTSTKITLRNLNNDDLVSFNSGGSTTLGSISWGGFSGITNIKIGLLA